MTITNGLAAFLRTGSLVPLRLGQGSAEVKRALGETQMMHIGDSGRSVVLKYGALQVGIVDRKVRSIEISYRDPDERIPEILGDLRGLDASTTVDVAAQLLDESGIVWSVEQSLSFSRQVCLATEGGVVLLFSFVPAQLECLQVSLDMRVGPSGGKT